MRHTFNSCVHAAAFQMELTDLRRAVYFNFARALGSLVAAPHPFPVNNGFKIVLKSFIIREYILHWIQQPCSNFKAILFSFFSDHKNQITSKANFSKGMLTIKEIWRKGAALACQTGQNKDKYWKKRALISICLVVYHNLKISRALYKSVKVGSLKVVFDWSHFNELQASWMQ